jgi:hypothetical protein
MLPYIHITVFPFNPSNYRTFIREPMDLGTIALETKMGYYGMCILKCVFVSVFRFMLIYVSSKLEVRIVPSI